MDGLVAAIKELLADVQRTLIARALAFRDERTQRIATYEEFVQAMEGRPGFVIAPWCGSAECEARIKTDTQATIRNMPLAGSAPGGTCVRCDAPATSEAWFAKSY
jgi:prolyl-tRNA synthetase